MKNAVFKISIFVVAIVLWSVLSPVSAFLWDVFLVWWAFRLDSRVLGGVAIMFLIATAIASALHSDARAEQFAVYVYFLLVMTVVLQIIELWRERKEVGEEVAEEFSGGIPKKVGRFRNILALGARKNPTPKRRVSTLDLRSVRKSIEHRKVRQ